VFDGRIVSRCFRCSICHEEFEFGEHLSKHVVDVHEEHVHMEIFPR